MNLIVFIPSLEGGGAERVMLRISGEMVSRGHSVRLVVASKAGALISEIPDGVELVDLGAGRLLSAILPLARELTKRPCDTILSAMTATNCVAALARMASKENPRLVMSERAFPSQVGLKGKLNQFLVPKLRSKLYPEADLITTVSNEVKEDLHRLVDVSDDRILSIYNPVPQPSLISGNSPHDWVSPTRDRPVFISVGRLNSQKDQATMIRAFAKVRNSKPARLVILGEGEKREYLEALVHSLGIEGDVLMPGFSSNVQDWLRGSDVFVMSSVMEGMPNALVEALSLELRAVCTACVGGPREVLGFGRYGRLVPEGDVDCLAVAMEQSLGDPRPSKEDLYLERFDPDVIFAQYEKALCG
jgi:glycosyltransferase involved in cell wall biosynthesis